MELASAGAGGGAAADAKPSPLDAVQRQREAARREFEERFAGVYEKHASGHPDAFAASLRESLTDMPKHCLARQGFL